MQQWFVCHNGHAVQVMHTSTADICCMNPALAMNMERLISLVRERPWLYDSSHKQYQDVLKAANSWKAIGEELEMEGKRVWSSTRWLRLMVRHSRSSLQGISKKSIR